MWTQGPWHHSRGDLQKPTAPPGWDVIPSRVRSKNRDLLTVTSQTSAHSQIITPPPVSTQENLLVSLEGLGWQLESFPCSQRHDLAQTPDPPSQGSHQGEGGAPAELRNWGAAPHPKAPHLWGHLGLVPGDISAPPPKASWETRGTSGTEEPASAVAPSQGDWGPMGVSPPLTESPGGAAPGPGTVGRLRADH